MRYQHVENGAIVPSLELRAEFARDLWETIKTQVLNNRTSMTHLVHGSRMSFALPPPMHLLDFVTISETDEPDTVIVDIQFPARELYRNTVYSLSIQYSPPKY